MEDAAVLLQYAKQSEDDGFTGDAISYYVRAMEQYLNLAPTIKDEHKKGGILETVCLISRRVELLRSMPSRGGRKVSPVVGGGGNGGGGKDAAIGDEPNSMKSQIESLKLDAGTIKKIHWNDVIGMATTKKLLMKTISVYDRMPHLVGEMRKAPKGMLLFGPPGVGKTYIVSALASNCNRAFFNIPVHHLRSKFLGDSGKMIDAMFDVIRAAKPAILFIDEVDALCGDRESGQQHGESSKALNTLLTCIDGLGNSMDGVLFIGGTNRPFDMDDAVLRRMEHRIYTPLPDKKDRYQLLIHSLSQSKGDYGPPIEKHLLEDIAERMVNYSNSDIVNLVRNAYEATWDIITEATHFKAVLRPDDPTKYCVIPCKPDEEGAKKLSYEEINDLSMVRALALTYENLCDSLLEVKPVTSAKKIAKFEAWAKEHGKV
jgi:vacuolar protein-sorting-associated protein 4